MSKSEILERLEEIGEWLTGSKKSLLSNSMIDGTAAAILLVGQLIGQLEAEEAQWRKEEATVTVAA